MAVPVNMLLGVKNSLFRIHDFAAEEANAEYRTVRFDVMKRDNWVCTFCGMSTLPKNEQNFSGFFEVHHIDDDHHNNDKSNLVTVCPFCHSVFHCGNAGHRESGSIIWMPFIRQEDLNIMVHVLFILMSYGEEENQQIKNAIKSLDKTFIEKAKDFAMRASELYENLRQLEDEADRMLGNGMSNAAVLGEALAMLYRDDPSLYENREAFLFGARFLPDYSYYQSSVMWWAYTNVHQKGGGEVVSPKILDKHWLQFQRLLEKANF